MFVSKLLNRGMINQHRVCHVFQTSAMNFLRLHQVLNNIILGYVILKKKKMKTFQTRQTEYNEKNCNTR